MKHSELKHLIKEEIRKVLNENQFKASNTVSGKKIELIIDEKYLQPNKINALISKLNKAGWELGSGHDKKEIEKDGNRYILFLLPYVGAPSQKVEFKIIK